MKLLLLSDLHVGRPAGRGFPVGDLLKLVVAAHPSADHMVILGDLSDRGNMEDYEALKAGLRDLPIDVSLLVGNHDDRASFQAVFGAEACAQPVQYVANVADRPLYILDTTVPGRDGGSMDDGRADWLDARLSEADRPGFILMHHPPIETGTPAYARIGLADRAAFAALMARHRSKIDAVFFGHCHMHVHGPVAGVPAFGLASTCFQSRPVFGEDSFAEDLVSPATYGLLVTGAYGFSFHAIPLEVAT